MIIILSIGCPATELFAECPCGESWVLLKTNTHKGTGGTSVSTIAALGGEDGREGKNQIRKDRNK